MWKERVARHLNWVMSTLSRPLVFSCNGISTSDAMAHLSKAAFGLHVRHGARIALNADTPRPRRKRPDAQAVKRPRVLLVDVRRPPKVVGDGQLGHLKRSKVKSSPCQVYQSRNQIRRDEFLQLPPLCPRLRGSWYEWDKEGRKTPASVFLFLFLFLARRERRLLPAKTALRYDHTCAANEGSASVMASIASAQMPPCFASLAAAKRARLDPASCCHMGRLRPLDGDECHGIEK